MNMQHMNKTVCVILSSILHRHTSPYQQFNFPLTDAAQQKCHPCPEQILGLLVGISSITWALPVEISAITWAYTDNPSKYNIVPH
jgi:hypothetical protein